ncbi:MAG: class II glutamine amidotransferase, partial [Thermoproteota archaeon]
MCRMLGAMFVESNSVENHLLDAECSILKQAVKGGQSDGWGIGFYMGRVPIVFKSEKAVYEEEEKFKEVAKSTKGRIIIVHVRKASNPRGLPRERLISPENSQPFNYSNYLLAHNGSINIPDEVIKRLGPYGEFVKSNNDSEVYFYLLLSLIEKENDVITAFKNVEKTLM